MDLGICTMNKMRDEIEPGGPYLKTSKDIPARSPKSATRYGVVQERASSRLTNFHSQRGIQAGYLLSVVGYLTE